MVGQSSVSEQVQLECLCGENTENPTVINEKGSLIDLIFKSC